MIKVTDLVSEFNKADLDAYIQAYTLGDLQFKTFFPSKYTTELTFKSLSAATGAKVAADVVSFDSRAPRKGRQLPSSVMGDIPKIYIEKFKKETDINIYKQLQQAAARTNNPQTVNALIEWIYGDSAAALDGVNAKMELLAKEAVSSGKYTLTPANNPGGVVTKAAVDFQIPNGNQTSASVAWSAANAATSDPVKDIKAIAQTARGKGFKLNYITMDMDTFNAMTASDKLQKFCAGFVNNALGLQTTPNLATVNSAFSAAGLPTIRVWDSYITVEGKDGALTSVTGWTAGNVVLSISPTFGDIQWTDTADSQVNIDDSTKSFSDFAMVKTYAEQNPISLVTLGIAYATPVLQNANQLFILKTA
ncbi:MAG: major capsid protein [Parafilimonas sp.]